MPDYPGWVLEHKKKGTYINFQNGKYYLYAAHSERIPGTDKVRRVSDGYLGRITEKDGLVPAKKNLPANIMVYEYGLSETVLLLCAKVRTGLAREFRASADFVMAGGMLLFMHGEIRQELYESSWLSVRMPGLDMKKAPTEKQRTGMERVQRMIEDALKNRFAEGYHDASMLLPLVKVVRAGKEERLAAAPDGAGAFFRQYGLLFEEV